MLSDISLPCNEDFSPVSIGFPTATDNEDPNPVINYVDEPAEMCTLRRIWNASDDAGNNASLIQTITFTVPQPPQILTSRQLTIPCGNVEDAIQNAEKTTLTVIHPCERPVTTTFTDSAPVDRCGFTFTRTWVVLDDCGTSSTLQQTIRVLDQQLPDSPSVVRSTLDWMSPYCGHNFQVQPITKCMCGCLEQRDLKHQQQ